MPDTVDDPKPQIIVYGTVCLDRFERIDASGNPLPGTLLEMPGGEAFNTATALAGWGADVLLTGTALGQDEESDRLRALLDDPLSGLSRRWIPELPSAVTPVCTVRVSQSGERYMNGRGYDRAVPPPPLPKALFTAHPVVAIDPNLGQAASEAALRAAEFGSPIVAMDFQNDPEVIRVAQIALTSRDWLSRRGFLQGLSSLEAAARLVDMGARTAIVTEGERGCIVVDTSNGEVLPVRVPAFDVPDIVDTTGAGDTFRAGLCWGLLPRKRPWSLRRTLRFASAAAAIHCTVLGGGSRPSLQAIYRLLHTGTFRPIPADVR